MKWLIVFVLIGGACGTGQSEPTPTACIGPRNAWVCEGTPLWEAPSHRAWQRELRTEMDSPTTWTPTPTPEAVTEAAPPEAPPIYVAPVYAPGSIEAIVCAYDWPCNEALAIVDCETGGKFNADAYNPSGASGWFQMMMPLWAGLMDGDPFDPYVNTLAAYRLYVQSGRSWYHWSCAPW